MGGDPEDSPLEQSKAVQVLAAVDLLVLLANSTSPFDPNGSTPHLPEDLEGLQDHLQGTSIPVLASSIYRLQSSSKLLAEENDEQSESILLLQGHLERADNESRKLGRANVRLQRELQQRNREQSSLLKFLRTTHRKLDESRQRERELQEELAVLRLQCHEQSLVGTRIRKLSNDSNLSDLDYVDMRSTASTSSLVTETSASTVQIGPADFVREYPTGSKLGLNIKAVPLEDHGMISDALCEGEQHTAFVVTGYHDAGVADVPIGTRLMAIEHDRMPDDGNMVEFRALLKKHMESERATIRVTFRSPGLHTRSEEASPPTKPDLPKSTDLKLSRLCFWSGKHPHKSAETEAFTLVTLSDDASTPTE